MTSDDSSPSTVAERAAPADVRMVLLVLEAGADPLDRATPLHEAGTPALDRVARDGHVGRVDLRASSCWDGFTGLLGAAPRSAPLGPAEALAAGIDAGVLAADGSTADGSGVDRSSVWAARVDLVTVDDGRVLDPFGGRIDDPEASALFEDTAGALPHGRLLRLPGRRGLWVCAAALPDAPPPWDVGPPWEVGPRAPRAVFAAAPSLLAVYEASRRALTQHDVNAVRVDLGENPANALWPHGAGVLPLRMEPPSWAAGRRVALVAGGGPAQGVARALGWDGTAVDGDDDALCAAALAALATHDIVVIRTSTVLAACRPSAGDAHAARVDAFASVDARLAAPLLGALEERGPFVFAVAADGVVDSASGSYSAEPVPCGVVRGGVVQPAGGGHGLTAFHESSCAEGGARISGAEGFAALLQHEIAELS